MRVGMRVVSVGLNLAVWHHPYDGWNDYLCIIL